MLAASTAFAANPKLTEFPKLCFGFHPGIGHERHQECPFSLRPRRTLFLLQDIVIVPSSLQRVLIENQYRSFFAVNCSKARMRFESFIQ